MTEHKYTDEEVIKALECCSSAECERCAWEPSEDCYKGSLGCNDDLMRSALDLINRQKAEIERLTIDMNAARLGMIAEHERLKTARAEAIKEFAEKLKKEAGYFGRAVAVETINDLVKEFTEE